MFFLHYYYLILKTFTYLFILLFYFIKEIIMVKVIYHYGDFYYDNLNIFLQKLKH